MQIKMKDYYEQPTQVMFGVDEGEEINTLAGLAYQDYVICLDCGEVIPLQSGQFDHGFRELPWISLSDECLGDETLDKEGQKMPSGFEVKTQVRAYFTCGNEEAKFILTFDSSTSDEEISQIIKKQYCEWAKAVCQSYVPQAFIDRFDDMIEEYGLTEEELHWEKIYG